VDRFNALMHAAKAHADATDKCGQPYVLHPIAVAQAITDNTSPASEWGEDGPVVGLIHDIWEDTDYDLPTNQLRWSQRVAFQAVTRLPDETYRQYIEGICNCEYSVAIIVKLADLWHNLQPERQGGLPEQEARSLEKRYLKARAWLWEALGQEWWPA
jgi:GTP pyrophosphokinase